MSSFRPALSIAQAHARLTAPGARFETAPAAIRGRTMMVWKHAPDTAAALFVQARAGGGAEFLIYGDQRISFEAFSRAALAVAASLKARGLNKGDRVALAMRNLPHWPVVFFGGLLAGAILVPLNAWWTAAELEHALRDSGSRFLFCDAERLARIAPCRERCPALEEIYGPDALDAMIGEPCGWGALPEGVMPDAMPAPEDEATIFYTSGTSGKARGVLGTHRNLTINAWAFAFSTARNALRRGEEPPPPVRRVTLLPVPFFHVIGCVSVLISNMAAGGKLVLMRKFDAEKAFALIAREQVTAVSGVPAIALRLLEHPARSRHDLSSLRTLTYGGAPSPARLPGALAEAFPGVQPGNGWGMTETSATCTTHYGDDYLNRPDSCGPPLPIYRLKVTDREGRDLPPGAVGELWAFGAHVAKAYWNDERATAAAFRGGWVRTGDLARLDDEGFCTILDRIKDVLIRGGEKISCGEVERVLSDHPAVSDAAVVGLPHPVLGEEPAALVHLRPGEQLSEAALRAHAGARLAPFKVPSRILFSPDLLPRGATGKLMRAELVKLFAS
jgi:long-chain acyl-CoA synthetase